VNSAASLKTEAGDRTAAGPGPLWAVLLAAGTVLADTSILNVVAPLIEKDFASSIAELQLAVAGYQIAYASTLVLGGWMGDRYGRHTVLRWGLLLFAVASLACTAAPGMHFLIAARVVQGVAAGVLFPQALGILRTLADPQERGRALGSLAMVMSLATVAGPVVAGILVRIAPQTLSWRLIFLVNLPVCVLVWLVALRRTPRHEAPAGGRPDVVGAIWTAVTVVSVAVPLTLGRQTGWPVWSLALAVAAVPIAVGYGVFEQRRYAAGKSCIVPIGAFRNPQLLRAVLGYFLFFAASTCFFLYFSLLVQAGTGATALLTGLALAPYGVGAAISSRLAPRLVTRWNARVVVAGGALVCALGSVATAVLVWWLPADRLTFGVAPALVVTGLGLGFVVAPVLGVVLSLAAPTEAGAVGGALTTGQQIGGAVGIVLFGLFLPVTLGADLSYRALAHAFTHGVAYEAVLFAAVAVLFGAARRRAVS
jgi:MFS family permease